ncbi:MAG TPA: hypothetical protein VIT90_12670 [Lysobacter sp.]
MAFATHADALVFSSGKRLHIEDGLEYVHVARLQGAVIIIDGSLLLRAGIRGPGN